MVRAPPLLLLLPLVATARPLDTLLNAAADGDVPAVAAALRERPELASARNELGETPLHHAALGGAAAVIPVLIAAGADPNAASDGYDGQGLPYHRTPLMWAMPLCDADVTRALIAGGARAATRDGDGRDSVDQAAEQCGVGSEVHRLLRASRTDGEL
eukprot:TRINITY_DN36338_c0_g1_i1.p2 TRINITY_DN36338_c0_g1~~TRINITY_DN36338_c0_g1_i1.p2  ORF type:complete len:158 (+),score=49.31 TRINITY_DN36338_c0_g1_i1:50-523(+)